MPEDGQAMYEYDEVVFVLPEDRHDTMLDIELAFSDWWVYGSQPDEGAVSLEDRVTDLENVVLELIGGMV